MTNKELEKIVRQARNEDLISFHSLHKHGFQALLSGMITKLMGSTKPEAKRQLAALQKMDRFMERLTQMNVMYIIQAKMLQTMDRQVAILEQEKLDIIEEYENKIKMIETLNE